MSGRVRVRLGAACAWIMAAYSGPARAQETAPVAWPPIDVWGVSDHAIGQIRLAQPTVNGVVRYSLIGAFVPADGKLLRELAAALWPDAKPASLHFNWVQITVSPGNPPGPVGADATPLKAPFIDPPAGGYAGDAKPADAIPWFLDESPYRAGVAADLNIHNPGLVRPNALRWYARPYSSAVPDAMSFDTVLVLINDTTRQYEPLGGFHWAAHFPAQGTPSFQIAPFGPQEWFGYAALVSAYERGSAGRAARRWALRPLPTPGPRNGR